MERFSEFFSSFGQRYDYKRVEDDEKTSKRSPEGNLIINVTFLCGGPAACPGGFTNYRT